MSDTNPTQPINQPTKLGGMLEDNTGGTSSMRVLMLMWGLGVFAVWAFASVMAVLHGLPIATLPTEIITILLGVTGIKTVQRFGEK